MPLSPQALVRGVVARLLPTANVDSQNNDVAVRLGRYGEVAVNNLVGRLHNLADEGSYFVANNAGTGVATAAAPTAFSDTAPLLNIFNKASAASGTRIYLDYFRMAETAAGTAGTGVQFLIKLDTKNDYSSGGTQITPVSPNIDISPASLADVRFLPTNVAVSGTARTVAFGTVFAGATAPIAVGSQAAVTFGSQDGVPSVVISGTTGVGNIPFPPIIIGPGESAIIEFLILSQSAASSWTPDVGWWER